ncbi:hypothetical protein [Fusobacterium sp. PH5-44]|uniref:hypothetical protein n=1 Tax=unclassified Fusobacterium TaxID=2648384 RepID=UPI003D250894
MDLKKNLNKIRIVIFLCAAIFLAGKYFLTGSVGKTYKLSQDISRVENEQNYSITFDEFAKLLEEIDPKANIKADSSSKSHENKTTKAKYYSRSLTFNSHRITCYSAEENGKLANLIIFSGRGLGKSYQSTKDANGVPRINPNSLEFKTTVTSAFKKNAAILNNILNSSATQKDLNKFLNKNIGKKIITGLDADVGDSNIYFFVDGHSLALSFIPKQSNTPTPEETTD